MTTPDEVKDEVRSIKTWMDEIEEAMQRVDALHAQVDVALKRLSPFFDEGETVIEFEDGSVLLFSLVDRVFNVDRYEAPKTVAVAQLGTPDDPLVAEWKMRSDADLAIWRDGLDGRNTTVVKPTDAEITDAAKCAAMVDAFKPFQSVNPHVRPRKSE